MLKTLLLGPYRVRVAFEAAPPRTHLGSFDPRSFVITVSGDLPPAQQRVTLLHEAVHLLADVFGLDLDERTVEVAGVALADLLGRSDWLALFLAAGKPRGNILRLGPYEFEVVWEAPAEFTPPGSEGGYSKDYLRFYLDGRSPTQRLRAALAEGLFMLIGDVYRLDFGPGPARLLGHGLAELLSRNRWVLDFLRGEVKQNGEKARPAEAAPAPQAG